jgi:hypothetical protein
MAGKDRWVGGLRPTSQRRDVGHPIVYVPTRAFVAEPMRGFFASLRMTAVT